MQISTVLNQSKRKAQMHSRREGSCTSPSCIPPSCTPPSCVSLRAQRIGEKSAENEKNSISTNKRESSNLASEEGAIHFYVATSLERYIGTFLATILYRGFVLEKFSGTVLLETSHRDVHTTCTHRLTTSITSLRLPSCGMGL